jgi:hypothetical protein
MSRESDNAAAAVRSYVERALAQVLQADYGVVRSVSPLQVELGHTNDVLDSDELVVTQEVRRYDAQVGLEVGDSLALMPMESGEYLAVGVVANEADPSTGAPAPAPDPGGYGAWLPGDLKPTARAAASAGWLLADGSVQSRAAYPALAAALGADGVNPGVYNVAGDTLNVATQFRLPDGTGRSLIGAGTATAPTKAADSTAHTRGSYGGTEGVAITVTEMAAHSHSGTTGAGATGTANAALTVDNAAAIGASVSTNSDTATTSGPTPTTTDTSGSHQHSLPVWYDGTSGNAGRPSASLAQGGGVLTATVANATGAGTGGHAHSLNAHTHTLTTVGHAHTVTVPIHGHTVTQTAHGHTIPSQGGGQPHSNLSPFFTGLWLIKT